MLDRHHHGQSGVVGKEANKAKRGVILPGSLEINRGDSTGGIVAASGRFVLLLGFTHGERTWAHNLLEPMQTRVLGDDGSFRVTWGNLKADGVKGERSIVTFRVYSKL